MRTNYINGLHRLVEFSANNFTEIESLPTANPNLPALEPSQSEPILLDIIGLPNDISRYIVNYYSAKQLAILCQMSKQAHSDVNTVVTQRLTARNALVANSQNIIINLAREEQRPSFMAQIELIKESNQHYHEMLIQLFNHESTLMIFRNIGNPDAQAFKTALKTSSILRDFLVFDKQIDANAAAALAAALPKNSLTIVNLDTPQNC